MDQNGAKLLGAVLGLAGGALFYFALLFQLTDAAPRLSMNPRSWLVTHSREERTRWFRPGGWWLYHIGLVLMLAGFLLFTAIPFLLR